MTISIYTHCFTLCTLYILHRKKYYLCILYLLIFVYTLCIILSRSEGNVIIERGLKMKQYGAMFATEFTKKQINVIFAKAKSGALKVEKWFISELYNLADFYGYDDNRGVAAQERNVLNILEAVFANDNETAQTLISETANDWFKSYGNKNRAKCDRSVFVK